MALITYFGSIEVPAQTIAGAPLQKRNEWFRGLTAVAVEEWSTIPVGTPAIPPISIMGGFATLSDAFGGPGQVDNNTSNGRFNTTGANSGPVAGRWWETPDTWQLDFTTPVSAFGLYITDIGDFAGTLNVILHDGIGADVVLPVPSMSGTSSGNLAFFGFRDDGRTYTRITFEINQVEPDANDWDYLGFDSITVGTTAPPPAVTYDPYLLVPDVDALYPGAFNFLLNFRMRINMSDATLANLLPGVYGPFLTFHKAYFYIMRHRDGTLYLGLMTGYSPPGRDRQYARGVLDVPFQLSPEHTIPLFRPIVRGTNHSVQYNRSSTLALSNTLTFNLVVDGSPHTQSFSSRHRFLKRSTNGYAITVGMYECHNRFPADFGSVQIQIDDLTLALQRLETPGITYRWRLDAWEDATLPAPPPAAVGSVELRTLAADMAHAAVYQAFNVGAAEQTGVFDQTGVTVDTSFADAVTVVFAAPGSHTARGTVVTTIPVPMWEFRIISKDPAEEMQVGYFCQAFGPPFNSGADYGGPLSSWYRSDGQIEGLGGGASGFATWGTGDIIGVVYDRNVAGLVHFFLNGVYQGPANAANNLGFPMCGMVS